MKPLPLSLILFYFITSAHADVIHAASCSRADVQIAINSASNGDTVLVPSGHCTWSAGVTITGQGITLQGAGIDQTTIVDNIASADTLRINISNTDAITRITGFTFNANNTAKTSQMAEITLSARNSALDKFRIDHIKITNLRSRGILVLMGGHDVGGLIDHCEINAPSDFTAQGITIEGAGPQAGKPFRRPFTPGTNHAIYIEDNTFTFNYFNDGANDAYTGARYVMRYNIIKGTAINHHGADSGDGRGIATFEFYNNTFDANNVSSISRVIFLRSGTGVIFNNTATTANGGSYTSGIVIANYRSCGSFNYWGQCDGTSIWDGNQPGHQGYPCLDQVGHYFTDSQGGSSTVKPLYSWNNTLNGAQLNTTKEGLGNACVRFQNVHMIENRDFYNEAKQFNGRVGIGTGLLSERPSTCIPKTAYWATDTNTLYQCSSTDTWTKYYTPYTYPHPLQVGGLPLGEGSSK